MALRSKSGGQVLEFQKTTCSCSNTPFHQDKVCLQGWQELPPKVGVGGAGPTMQTSQQILSHFSKKYKVE